MEDGVVEASDGLAGGGQYFGVQGVERSQFHADGTAGPCQPTTEGADLGTARQDDPDRGQWVVAPDLLDACDAELGLASGCGCDKENAHRKPGAILRLFPQLALQRSFTLRRFTDLRPIDTVRPSSGSCPLKMIPITSHVWSSSCSW